jgi:hypothetical protein
MIVIQPVFNDEKRNIFFTSPEHKARLRAILEKLHKLGTDDQEYTAALYVLTSSAGLWQRLEGYVSHGIDFTTMLEEQDFSGGIGVLVRLAGNLFNGTNEDTPSVDIPTRLDDRNFLVALTALQVRRYGLLIDDLK